MPASGLLARPTAAQGGVSREAAHTYHVDYFGVDGLRDHIAVVGDVLHHLTESSSLHFLPLEVTQWVRNKVEEDTTLT